MTSWRRRAAESRRVPHCDPVERYIGSRIRLRRKMLGMSQAGLSAALGVSYQQVQKYETGLSRIGAGRLHQIACALKTPVSFLFPPCDGEPAPCPAEEIRSATDLMASSEAVDLSLAAMRIADPELRRSLIQLARSMSAGRGGRAAPP